MKSIKTIGFASGLLVVVAVLICLSNEETSRNQATSANNSMATFFTSERCSSCSSADALVEDNRRVDGTEQIYILAFHLAALLGFSSEKTSRDQTPPVNSPGFAVVELFTSEGCNTCPPADELVKNIQGDDRTGKIYVLAFHVDYWDHQGWKDQFSEKEFTNRQIQYAGWLKLQNIYTPQIVVNGTTQHVGSDKRSVLKAISTGLGLEAPRNLTLSARIEEGNEIQVEYQTVIEDKNSELIVALVQKNSDQVAVTAGENMGRSLSHVQIVRTLTRYPVKANSQKVIVIEPPHDFTKEGWEIIGFVQNTSNGRITSASRFNFE